LKFDFRRYQIKTEDEDRLEQHILYLFELYALSSDTCFNNELYAILWTLDTKPSPNST